MSFEEILNLTADVFSFENIQWRSGVPPSLIYPRTGPRATKSIAPRFCHVVSDVWTSWSQQSTKLRCKSCKHVIITGVGERVAVHTICSSLGENMWRSIQHVRSSALLCCDCSLPAVHVVLLIYPPEARTASSLNCDLGFRMEIGQYFYHDF